MFGRAAKSLICIGAITWMAHEPPAGDAAPSFASARRAVVAEARAACLADVARCAGLATAATASAEAAVRPARIPSAGASAIAPPPPPRRP
jgi:hypothetical protein